MASPRLTGASEYPSRQQAPQVPHESSVRRVSHRMQACQFLSSRFPARPGWKVCRQRPLAFQAQSPQVRSSRPIAKPRGWTGSRCGASVARDSRIGFGEGIWPVRSSSSADSSSSRSPRVGFPSSAGRKLTERSPRPPAKSATRRSAALFRSDGVASGHQREAASIAARAHSRNGAGFRPPPAWRSCGRSRRPTSRGSSGNRPDRPGRCRAFGCRGP